MILEGPSQTCSPVIGALLIAQLCLLRAHITHLHLSTGIKFHCRVVFLTLSFPFYNFQLTFYPLIDSEFCSTHLTPMLCIQMFYYLNRIRCPGPLIFLPSQQSPLQILQTLTPPKPPMSWVPYFLYSKTLRL